MFPERFLPKKHRFVVRFQSKALAYTHMALLKERGILEPSRPINIALLRSEDAAGSKIQHRTHKAQTTAMEPLRVGGV